jgi:hypothetical protein
MQDSHTHDGVSPSSELCSEDQGRVAPLLDHEPIRSVRSIQTVDRFPAEAIASSPLPTTPSRTRPDGGPTDPGRHRRSRCRRSAASSRSRPRGGRPPGRRRIHRLWGPAAQISPVPSGRAGPAAAAASRRTAARSACRPASRSPRLRRRPATPPARTLRTVRTLRTARPLAGPRRLRNLQKRTASRCRPAC